MKKHSPVSSPSWSAAVHAVASTPFVQRSSCRCPEDESHRNSASAPPLSFGPEICAPQLYWWPGLGPALWMLLLRQLEEGWEMEVGGPQERGSLGWAVLPLTSPSPPGARHRSCGVAGPGCSRAACNWWCIVGKQAAAPGQPGRCD